MTWRSVLFLILLPSVLYADWSTEGFTEEQQFQFSSSLCQQKLFYSCFQASEAYLKSFPPNPNTESIIWLWAFSSEKAEFPLHVSLSFYQEFSKRFPTSPRNFDSILAQGRLEVRRHRYPQAMTLLEPLVQETQVSSSLQSEASYWLGVANFQSAIRSNPQISSEQAKIVSNYLEQVTFPQELSEDAQKNRFYLLGWSAHYQELWKEAHAWFEQYLLLEQEDELKSQVLYQMAQNERRQKNYSAAFQLFSRLDLYPKTNFFNLSRFWKAETLFFHSHSHLEILPSDIISLYQDYLQTEDSEYRDISSFRLGFLYQQEQRDQEAIPFLKNYVNLGRDTEFLPEAQLYLGQIYARNNDHQQAIPYLENATTTSRFSNSTSVYLLLSQSYYVSSQFEKQSHLLLATSKNETFSQNDRTEFFKKWVQLNFQNQKWKSLLQEIQMFALELTQEEQDYFLYVQGSSAVQTKQWKLARAKLEKLIEVESYQVSLFPLLMITYQNLKRWNSLVKWMKKHHLQPQIKYSSQEYEVWAFATFRLRNWKALLKVYQTWEKKYPQDFHVERKLAWLQAAQKARKPKLQNQLILQILPILPKKREQLRIQLVTSLATKHIKTKNYQAIIDLYTTHLLPYLQTKERKIQYALYVGKLNFQYLNNIKEAQKWLQQADQQGGSSDEMEAIFLLASIENQQKNFQQAIEILQSALQRKDTDTEWQLAQKYLLGNTYEQMRQFSNAITSYRRVIQQSSTNATQSEYRTLSQERMKIVENYQQLERLDQLVQQKQWKDVVTFIEENQKKNDGLLKEPFVFESLLLAYVQLQEWKNVLLTYAEGEKIDAKRTTSLQALLQQGQASEKLGNQQQAQEFYTQAWEIVQPKTQQEHFFFLGTWLSQTYLQQNQIPAVIEIQKQLYAHAENQESKSQYAFSIGYYYRISLQDSQKAKLWLEKVDQQGVSAPELNSIYWLVEDKLQTEKWHDAKKQLSSVLERKIPKNSSWYLLLHYQMGIVTQRLQQWKEALQFYSIVANLPTSSEFSQYQLQAQKIAKEIEVYLANPSSP